MCFLRPSWQTVLNVAVSGVLAASLNLTVQYARGQAPGFDVFDPANAAFLASPGSIRPAQGKYPTSVPFVLWLNGCVPNSTASAKTLDPATYTYEIAIAGVGLSTAGQQTASVCSIATTLNIDASQAAPGFYIVTVNETTTASKVTTQRGHAILALLNSTAGPIPADQQVDVIWGVLSRHLCADNFGRHVASDVYCIEVKIGNNTGYGLQLAGVGFRPSAVAVGNTTYPAEISPNVAYESVRAAAQASQLFTARNLFVNGSGALGILMASFNPFFRSSFNVARWAAGTAIVGTALPSAVNAMSQDPTLRQLNNLDDESFRDGKLIPNNTQIRTMVFVERRLLDGIGNSVYTYWCNAIYDSGTKSGAKNANRCAKGKDDPYAVRLALGNLVIVGDEIGFVQRIVVDPNVTSQEVTPNATAATAIVSTDSVALAFNGVAPPATSLAQATIQLQPGGTAIPLGTPTGQGGSQVIFALPKQSGGSPLQPGAYKITIPSTAPGVPPITTTVRLPQ
ncbi:MAG: hypothetical protein ACRD19_12280 [Terriglobia bacterium]